MPSLHRGCSILRYEHAKDKADVGLITETSAYHSILEAASAGVECQAHLASIQHHWMELNTHLRIYLAISIHIAVTSNSVNTFIYTYTCTCMDVWYMWLSHWQMQGSVHSHREFQFDSRPDSLHSNWELFYIQPISPEVVVQPVVRCVEGCF